MQIHILDGSQGMCLNGHGFSSEPSHMSAELTSMKDQSNVSSSKTGKSRSSSSSNEKSGGLTATLASWIAPSPSSSTSSSSSNKDQQPSQRATSIPNPAGASASSPIEIHDDEAHHYTTSPNDTAPRPSLGPSSRRPPSTSTLSALLEPFNPSPHSNNRDTDGRIRIPATSRAGADIAEQKTATGVGLLESWKYLPFLAHQASKLASAFVSHHVFGPPKKSWGIELTLFTTAIRESVQYSHLSSLPTLRRFLNLGQILPVPKDGVVTPVTFQVFRRDLPGILANADAQEDGTRELTGEWVVSKRIWRRMQREHSGHAVPHPSTSDSPQMPRRKSSSSPANPSAPSLSTRPQATHQCSSNSSSHQSSHLGGKDKVILYLHGGAYYTMSAATHRYITISVSKYTNCRVFAVNYRLAPECRWPGQIHDAVSAYLRLIEDLKIPPEIIIFAGDSAGGGLTLATIMYLRDNGFPLPSGAMVMSPWVDLTMSCDSWETNAPFDYLRMPSGDDHMNPIASLLGAANVKNLITHPYVSPLFGDFHNFPPLLIQCGDAECLRDEGTLLAHKASLAGVQVYHEVYEDCPHVFQAMFFLEASKKAFRSHRNFVKRILPSGPRTKEGRRQRVDMSEMDQEVMSDAHAIKADGQPELASLPASPRAMRRELSSLTPVSPDSAAAIGGSDRHQALRNLMQATGDQVDAGQETVEFLEEEGDLGYDDEEEDSNPFNVESSGASATTSDRDQSDTAEEGEFEQIRAPTGDGAIPEDGVPEGTPGDIAADLALSATAGMIKAGTAISGLNHHDLDSVAEEQDESIDNIEAQEQHAASSRMSTSTSSSSYHFPRSTSSQRLHANHPHPHYPHQQPYQQFNSRRKQDSTSNSSTPAHSPSASFSSLPHSFSPSGSHTPLASTGGRTPVSSAPSSPGASMRISQRQRSFSSLSMASLTPNNSLNRHGSSSSNRSLTEGTKSRPGHSRSNSSISIRTMRPGSFRENSKPRARANSHPDLQALLDSYDAAGPAQHTVMYMSEENEILGDDKDEGDVNNMDLDEPSAGSQDRSVSDDGSIDVQAFDT